MHFLHAAACLALISLPFSLLVNGEHQDKSVEALTDLEVDKIVKKDTEFIMKVYKAKMSWLVFRKKKLKEDADDRDKNADELGIYKYDSKRRFDIHMSIVSAMSDSNRIAIWFLAQQVRRLQSENEGAISSTQRQAYDVKLKKLVNKVRGSFDEAIEDFRKELSK